MMWRASCTVEMLKARAEFYAQLRAFFCDRGVFEVETPVLSRSTATDPQLESINAELSIHLGGLQEKFYLHTSPEFPMKRLLASGSGAIFQICKTFRNGESGSRHNPEFSMLEWYRPGFELTDLMLEVAELIETVLGEGVSFNKAQGGIKPDVLTYRDAFLKYLSIDPFKISDADLKRKSHELASYNGPELARDDYLNLLLSICIEPHLGISHDDKLMPVFLCEYPPSQASLAQVSLSDGGIPVAQRFELYINGLELANGYFELTESEEQLARFEQDNLERNALGLPQIPIDLNLVEALRNGMPSCAGVALGLDRLLMIKTRAPSIQHVIAFPIDRA